MRSVDDKYIPELLKLKYLIYIKKHVSTCNTVASISQNVMCKHTLHNVFIP